MYRKLPEDWWQVRKKKITKPCMRGCVLMKHNGSNSPLVSFSGQCFSFLKVSSIWINGLNLLPLLEFIPVSCIYLSLQHNVYQYLSVFIQFYPVNFRVKYTITSFKTWYSSWDTTTFSLQSPISFWSSVSASSHSPFSTWTTKRFHSLSLRLRYLVLDLPL